MARHWDEMWASIAVMLYVGDLKPHTQSDIENEMKEWFARHDLDVGDTPVRERARALWRQEDWRFYEHQWRHIWSYPRTSQQLFWRSEGRDAAAELVRFIRDYRRKRREIRSGFTDLSGTRFCKVTSIEAPTTVVDHMAERTVRTNGK